jgi:hypothetical protein
MDEKKMQNAIILTSALFGSAYMLGTIIKIFNDDFICNKSKPVWVYFMNGVYSFTAASIFGFATDHAIRQIIKM